MMEELEPSTPGKYCEGFRNVVSALARKTAGQTVSPLVSSHAL
jgi:hypothetical protein